jgi:hypothetical protein
MRAFTWSGSNGTTRVYRTIGAGHEDHIATINHKTPWYIDVDPITGATLTYRFAFAQGAQTVTFTTQQLASCAPPTVTGPAETPLSDVIEQDIDGDGNAEQLIGEVFQDTDGSTVPLATLDEAILLDTDGDNEPDVLWDPPAGQSSKVIVAGDRLYIPGSSITSIHSFDPSIGNGYVVVINKLLGGGVALAVETTDLNAMELDKPLGMFPQVPLSEETIRAIQAATLAAGLALVLPGSAGVPFSMSDIGRMFAHLSNAVFTIFASRKRKRAWGTVYDSVTKEPLDPAYVELMSTSGKVISSAITDLDGRYGFLVAPGSYRLRARKTNYAFPSLREQGRSHDVLYTDLYFGEEIVVGLDGAITRNIPMDPNGVDWNQVQKRAQHLTTFVRSFDRYVLAILDAVFLAGFGLVLWRFLADINPQTLGFVLLYTALLAFRLFVRRPRLYGYVGFANGMPLAYGVVRFLTPGGQQIAAKVLDERGRYMALLPRGTYRYIVERRVGEEETVPVGDGVVKTRTGVVNQRIVV